MGGNSTGIWAATRLAPLLSWKLNRKHLLEVDFRLELLPEQLEQQSHPIAW